MNAQPRAFEAMPAVRRASGLLIGLVGPSGTGKTFSALRLASGIARVIKGPIDLIDTENGRALHYAEKFKFNHVPFVAPFGPIDYLDAIRYCAQRGTKTIIVDSLSHEHDGAGGVLEIHDSEIERMAGGDRAKAERVKIAAWIKPKTQRKKLINQLLQLNVNVIATFRAKEKLKIQRGKDPIELGWQPICGDDFMYEMSLQMLLKPGVTGVPIWKSEFEGERAVTKLPEQFGALFGEPKQIDEELGVKLAEWAMGGARASPEDELVAKYARAASREEWTALEKQRESMWTRSTPAAVKERLKDASDTAADRLR